jgi:hypothetical protein
MVRIYEYFVLSWEQTPELSMPYTASHAQEMTSLVCEN